MMTAHAKRISTRAMALLLAVALLAPASALAVGPRVAAPTDVEPAGDGGTALMDDSAPAYVAKTERTAQPEVSASGETPLRLSEQRKTQIKAKVRDRIRTREARFTLATSVLEARLDRLEELAGTVGDAGGDVGTVLALIAEARALIEEAKALEEQATALFQAIAESEDPRATFEQARDTAIAAVKKLRDARAKAREAALTLSEIVEAMQEGE